MELEVLPPARSMGKMGSKAVDTSEVNNECKINSSVAVSSFFIPSHMVMMGRLDFHLFVSFTSEMFGTVQHIS
jgi:hypothetical protein